MVSEVTRVHGKGSNIGDRYGICEIFSAALLDLASDDRILKVCVTLIGCCDLGHRAIHTVNLLEERRVSSRVPGVGFDEGIGAL